MHHNGHYLMSRFVWRIIPLHFLHSRGKDCIHLANLKNWRMISKQQLRCLGAGTQFHNTSRFVDTCMGGEAWPFLVWNRLVRKRTRQQRTSPGRSERGRSHVEVTVTSKHVDCIVRFSRNRHSRNPTQCTVSTILYVIPYLPRLK
jgi:hypothetical protein